MKMIMTITFSLFFTTQTLLANVSQTEFQNTQDKSYTNFEAATTVDGITYHASIFEPKDRPIKSILIISPTMSGPNAVEKSLAQHFSKNGYLVIVTYNFESELTSPNPDTEKLDRDYYKPVLCSLGFMNMMIDKFQLPQDIPVFALGGSRGGITTVILASHIPNIRAAWFAVGGGDMPYIYAWSQNEEIAKFRKNHMRVLGMTDQNVYHAFLSKYLQNDPRVSCKNIKIPIHQTIATRDDYVPTVTQELLVNECPSHEVKRKKINHTSGVLTLVNDRKKIQEFFESSL